MKHLPERRDRPSRQKRASTILRADWRKQGAPATAAIARLDALRSIAKGAKVANT